AFLLEALLQCCHLDQVLSTDVDPSQEGDVLAHGSVSCCLTTAARPARKTKRELTAGHLRSGEPSRGRRRARTSSRRGESGANSASRPALKCTRPGAFGRWGCRSGRIDER